MSYRGEEREGDGEFKTLTDQHPMLDIRSGSDGKYQTWRRRSGSDSGLVVA